MSAYDDVSAERKHQDEKWGGASHDDSHTPYDWCSYIAKHNNKAHSEPENYRRRMVEVAALAVAAIESFDRTTR